MFGALSSAIIVVGIGLVYGITGTTNIGDSIIALANLDASLVPIGLLAVALFIAGFGFKMGLMPFHMWLPDAYEGSPTTIGALLLAGTKKAGFSFDPGYRAWNVCSQPRLDIDSCYSSGLYDDTWEPCGVGATKFAKNTCVLVYRTGRLYHDRSRTSPLF